MPDASTDPLSELDLSEVVDWWEAGDSSDVPLPEWLPEAGIEDDSTLDALLSGEGSGEGIEDWLGQPGDHEPSSEIEEILRDEKTEETSQPDEEAEIALTEDEADSLDLWLEDADVGMDSDLLAALSTVESQQEQLDLGEDVALEPAAEIPDWIAAAAPTDQDAGGDSDIVSEALESFSLEAELPQFAGPDQMADEDVLSEWEALESAQISASAEETVDDESDKRDSGAADEDWLRSLALSGEEQESESQPVQAEPVSAEDDIQETVEEVLQRDGDSADWLSGFDDQDVEESIPGPTPILAGAAVDEGEVETDGNDAEKPSEMLAEAARTAESVVDKVTEESDDSGSPSWLENLTPAEELETGRDESDALLVEPYDPFEGGSPDQVPKYQSAKDTGILQPDERPAWMAAFTGEEMPDADEEVDTAAAGIEGGEDTLTELPLVTDEDTLSPPDDQVVETVPDVSEQELESLALDTDEISPDGEMPDWLLAIADSEAAQLGELEELLDIEEPSPADETGQPEFVGEAWLQQEADAVAEEPADETTQPEPAMELDEEGAFESAEVVDEFALPVPPALEFEPDAPKELELSEPEKIAVEAISEAASATEDSVDEDEDAGADVEVEDVPYGSDRMAAVPEEEEVAQAEGWAHTKDVETGLDASESVPVELGDEPVPEDFSFGDWPPIWLREPKEGQPDGFIARRSGDAPEPPEWLRDVSEEEE